ncbi:MAG: type II 3-dehydroquinate dehydratase [Chloroflexi bacterium CG_4_10_14_0_8_um_filter_46_9]|nr:MAG: type II 3-dehydroquinate dehydratase [Chloroflexi bacterium CG_4_10_14_0_8_um_filter_46_9]
MKILIINGPNLNMLGKRDKATYGRKTLAEIDSVVKKQGEKLDAEITSFQSNSEGALVDFIQQQSSSADGIIINPGALTHYGFSLRDALADSGLPIIEVHLSNIYAREDWRAESVIAPIAKGQISGLGWQGYIVALQALVAELKGKNI